jgi:hypothetical protein
MALPRSIEVVVSDKGETKVEAKNFEDNGCLKATKSVEEALGKVKKRTNKPEMVKQPELGEKVKIGR